MTDNHEDYGDLYHDKVIRCVDCGVDFLWTAGEQSFYNDKRPPLAPPKRCKACREFRKRTIHPPTDLDDTLRRARALFGDTNTSRGVR